MLIKQKIIASAILVISIAILSDVFKVQSSIQLEKLFDNVVLSETPSLTSLIEIKSSARQASLKAVEYSIRGNIRDKNKALEAIEKVRLHLSNYIAIEKNDHGALHEDVNKLNLLVNNFIETTQEYLNISEGPSLSQLTIDESELHKARKKLINDIKSVGSTGLQLDLEKVKSEARKISIKSIEFYLRGIRKDHDKAIDAVNDLNDFSDKLSRSNNSKAVAEVVVSISAYLKAAKNYLKDISKRKSPVTSIYLYEENLNKSRKSLIHGLYDLIEMEKNELKVANSLAKSSINSLINVTTIASLFLIFIIIMLNIIIYRTISKPIASLVDATKNIGSGNLDTKINISSNDEIKVLADEFNKMVDQLKLSYIEREQALSTLKEREQDLSITLDSIGDAVIATDAEGNVSRMNPVAEQLTGWVLQDAKGQSLKKVFPVVNASTREPIENPVEKVLTTGEIVYLSNHTTLIAKDGKEYQIADSAAPISNNNQILGMVLVFNDVTEQYQLREVAAKNKRDMQAIMDNSPSIIYAKDMQGRYIFINQEWEKLYKLSNESVIGKTDLELFSEELAEKKSFNDKAILKTGYALKLEETVSHDDGVHIYVSSKFPLYDENDDTYAVCGISTDITEHKQQEEQLRRSQKMDALGKLTGGVAHDYNNMLGVILGYSDLLQDMVQGQPKLAKYVKEIHRAGERGAQLTKKLLAFSRNKNTNATVLNINTLLLDLKNILEKTLTARINLVLDLNNEVWSVYLDDGDLEDAILNMSINAMHAIKGNGQITIKTSNESVSAHEAEMLQLGVGDYVLLSVTDTGLGMDNETKEKIFEPFFSTKGESGTGLGLSQVYGFVERSGGAIKVYSEQNHGTCFTLYFPRQDQGGSGSKQQEKYDDVNLRGAGSILVVDDEPALIELSSEILSQNGYHVFSANSGKQALEIIEKESIDLLLTDVIMPEIDGYQLASIVQKKYPAIKIQMVSGFSDDRHLNLVDDILHKDLIHKPYSSETLLTKIRELLAK